MLLQLDPSHPLVWRSPTSLQVGVDRALVVLDDVTSAQERMIAALVVGVTRPGLELIATAADADSRTVRNLLHVVGPALRPHSDALARSDDTVRAPYRVLLTGRGATAEHIEHTLRTAGTHVLRHDPLSEPQRGYVVIIVDHYVVDPQSRGYWLRRDIPHLPVVVGDTSIRVGPLITPGVGPCLWCLDRARTDRDPAWPAIASQLWGRRSTNDRGIVAIEAAAIASRMLIAWASAAPSSRRAQPGTATTIEIGRAHV